MGPSQFASARRLAIWTLVLAAVTASGAACSAESRDAAATATTGGARGPVEVVAAFYPIAEAVQQVGGDRVEVQNLTPPGGGPHDLQLTPKDAEAIAGADVVVFVSKGFQPQVEQAVAGLPAGVRALDVLDGLDLIPVRDQLAGTQGDVDGEELQGGLDPHVWVDPVLQAQIAKQIHEELVEIDPAGRSAYDAGLAVYQRELRGLDDAFKTGLANCESRVIVTSHRAFEYLAHRYGLTQIAIAGLSPEAEPDPRTLEAVAAAAREHNVKVVFFEEQVPPDLSETVANEIGATTDALDPVETITAPDLDAGATYTTVMRANLESLKTGLGCR